MSRLLPCLAAALLAVAALACSDDAAPREPTPTPTAVVAAPPTLPSGLVAVGSGSVRLSVPANGRQAIDPLALARSAGVTPPPCAQFVFVFAWEVPPGQRLRLTLNRMGGIEEVAQGQRGQGTAGACALFEALNESAAGVMGELSYVLAEVRR